MRRDYKVKHTINKLKTTKTKTYKKTNKQTKTNRKKHLPYSLFTVKKKHTKKQTNKQKQTEKTPSLQLIYRKGSIIAPNKYIYNTVAVTISDK